VRRFCDGKEGQNVHSTLDSDLICDDAAGLFDADAVGLASTLATRLCHDMAGLLGTLAGTLDMADEDPEAKELAAETLETLIARVRLLRTAWGGGGGALDAGAILELAAGLPGIERWRLEMSALTGTLEETPARLVLCLMLTALGGMPRGGIMSLAAAPQGGAWIGLAGKAAGWPPALAQCADSDDACWRAAQAPGSLPAPLVCLLARQAGWRIDVDGCEARISERRPGALPLDPAGA
jgi:histidine phosphotransferase ChpT